MVRFVIVITLALVGQAFAQQPELPMDIAGDAGLKALSGAWAELTPNERVQQAFKALEEQQTATLKAFSGPYMQAYGDMSQFACTAIASDGGCVNPFSAMAKE